MPDLNSLGLLSETKNRLFRSTNRRKAIDSDTGAPNSSNPIYDTLIEIGALGSLRGVRYFVNNKVIPNFSADEGSGGGDWDEQGINYKNPQDEGVGNREEEVFEIDDDLLATLSGKTVRFVAYYTGSFDCELTETSPTAPTKDIYNKPSGSKAEGDMQITNLQQEEIIISGYNNNTPEYRTTEKAIFNWLQTTSAQNVKDRSYGETPLETYKKQGESPSAWKTLNAVSSINPSFIAGEWNQSIGNRKTPTSGSGGLNIPRKYKNFCSAYVNNFYGTEMWLRTGTFVLGGFVGNPTNELWSRITCALGSHGDACGTLTLYVYVEPYENQQGAPPDTTDPTGPDLVSAHIENDEATISWDRASDNVGLAGYHVYYRYKDVDETSFSAYDAVGTADTEERKRTYDLNSIFGLSERYGEFQFKIQPQDLAGNIGTGTEFPVKGQFPNIFFVTSGTQIVSSGGQTLSITGIQANDLIMLSGTSDSQQANAPTGFTELEDDDGTANPGAVVCYKIASGTSESITLTNQGGTGANQIIWSYQVFRNVSTSNPIDGSISNHNSGSSRINLPSLTTTTDNCMIVVYGMIDDDGYDTLDLPTGYTRTVMEATGSGFNLNYSTVVGGYKLEGAAGTYNPGFIQLSQNDGRDGFTIALRPKQEDFTTTLPSFDSIYWQATLGSPTTEFLVTCNIDITNFDIPTTVLAYVTIDGTTPTTSNYDAFAELTDTSTGNDGSSWSSSGYSDFSSNSVSLNDEVKVLLVAINAKGEKNSEVVTLPIANTGQNSTAWPDSPIQLVASTTGTFMSGMASTTTLSGIQSGDFVVAILSENSTTAIPLASGWTNIRSGSTISAQRTAYIFATGTSVSWSTTSSDSANGSIILAAFRNVNSTTPIDVTSTSNTATSNSITPASITTTTNNCMILTAMSSGGGDITVTDPTGYTRVAKSTGGGFFNFTPGVGVLTYKAQATSGTESPGSFGLGTSRAARTVTIALRKV